MSGFPVNPDEIIQKVLNTANQIFNNTQKTASETIAFKRMISTVYYGADLLIDLIEPYWKHNKAYQVIEICLYLHLYARILDDAVDEALPLHRLNLLKIQPLFWNTVTQISLSFPDKSNAVSVLIKETIQAVIEEWHKYRIETWGTKNHHLLTAPLLLSGSMSEFEQYKPYLSDFIFLLQAKEEILQNRLENAEQKIELLKNLEKLVSEDWIYDLHGAGWKTLAHRIPLELDFILLNLRRNL
ncbi:Uncharacterized protein dnl_48180 [Desulfonema limicola]|uniref:Uncharacterized protein n=1 Tax=Desulfonema limicola TaxID=45656 RepID=A0A975BBU3_9BACT|nr:hypothetical protein [Desulfonema limicola]QTA82443.1 Uncharacterized protein dnl_48180 [Desulfonema limicola]